ncbi:MAG: ATP-dependent DNA helicase RecG [Deltaproteobacteria bacterium]|nr:ATP-dependent DNA helicase RecG [Deltaproteobacteria bacterium]
MFPLPRYPGLNKGLRTIKGVGPRLEKLLNDRGFTTVGDLVSLMPVRYQDRRDLNPLDQLVPGGEVLAGGLIEETKSRRSFRTGRRVFEITVSDESGKFRAYWFRAPDYLKQSLKKGAKVILFGRISEYQGGLYILHPEITPWPDESPPVGEIRPVYPELAEIKPGVLRRIMAQVGSALSGLPIIFPKAWLEEQGLPDPTECLKTLHQPPSDKPGPVPIPEDSRAWRALARFELLFLQLSLARTRTRLDQEPGISFPLKSGLAREFLVNLPFQLTGSQKKVLREIQQAMAAPHPMRRLLQGDVGSGKTVLAAAAALSAIDAGYQAAFMAPTEILARQHFQTLLAHTKPGGIEPVLLTGGLPEAEKNMVREKLASGQARLVVGTHALFSTSVKFKSLGFAVIDEQHRFGVAQRLALQSKAERPDMLVMTATPIPRSLAMTLYGDLDLSIIEGLPPGRSPVKTRIFSPKERDHAYKMLAHEVSAGGQAFVVAPRIEPKEGEQENGEDLSAVEDLFQFVAGKILPREKIGLIHGRMSPQDQEEALESFRQGRTRVLVATTIIEVGLDVPQATVILVESADRFGLAQLHQLRGRVGRGEKNAQCLLVSGQANNLSGQRLEIMANTNDGFILAEEDMKLRGPGDAAGMKQSGIPRLTWASLPRHLTLLIQARDLARDMIAADPELGFPEFRLVREVVDQVDEMIQGELIEVG